MAHLTECEIMNMSLPKLLEVAKELGVNLEKCQNVDQFRERILLHKKTLADNHFIIQKEFSVRTSESLGNMQDTMGKLLAGVGQAMTQLSHPALERALQADCIGNDVGPSLAEEIQMRLKALKTAQYSVIVAGETNAGKTTLLNLILGMNILPTSILSCTAAVCVLRYSRDLRAQVVCKDGTTQEMTFTSADEARETLSKIVAISDDEQRERGSAVDTINIYLPAAVLHSGVALVDTPGIGENPAMDQCTLDYVRRNSAAAYIYVIKTDNAGGMQDDRLLEFLRAILKHNKSGDGAEVFDPSSAMFVCNRWDQVPKDQKERVQQNAFQKLKDVWPKFDPKQAYFISSTNSGMHWAADPRYVTQEFESVLRGMKDVFSKARQNAINQHYRWLKQILHQATMFLQTTIAQCSQSDEEHAKRFRTTAQKLEALQTKTAETTQKLRLKLEEEALTLCDDIAGILKEETTRKELEDWPEHMLPALPSLGSSNSQKWAEEADMVIIRRIMDIVDVQLRKLGLVRGLDTKFRQMAQEQLKLVDEEMDSIVVDMKDKDKDSLASSQSSSVSSESDEECTHELMRLYKQRAGVHLKSLTNISRARAFSHSTLDLTEDTLGSLPKVTRQRLLTKLLGPLAALKDAMKGSRRKSAYSINPLLYMQERSGRIASVMAKERPCLQQMALKYRERLDFLITDIDSSIPRFIARNKQLMTDIKENRRQFYSKRTQMVDIMEKLEPMRETLRGFGALYIRDVTADNICFMLDPVHRRASITVSVLGGSIVQDSGYFSSRASVQGLPASAGMIAQGLWSTYRWGHVTIDEAKENVIGRTYIQGLREDDLIREIARLRCLRCPCLASFLGMSRMENSAVFLFWGDLTPARRYLTKAFHEPRETVPDLLEGVLRGLDYLQREGLVHMELSLDTVMVDRKGDTKLCGACLPRRARFPPDAHEVDAKPFVYLSPEVLRGELYTSDDDVYSFGIMVWETCLRQEPYSEQRTLSLAEFRNTIHPSSMLGVENMNLSENLGAILRGCLLPARGLRLKMERLREMAGELRSDPTILSLSATNRRLMRKPLRKSSRTPIDEF